jgi:type II secretory pathway pseudopilin PulG
MKISSAIQNPAPAACRAIQAFTLAELLVAISVFSLVILAMVTVQIFGLRIYTLAATKLSATASGRETLNAMRDQIRSSKEVYVGTYDTSFSRIADGSPQTGNALEIFPTTNTAPSSTIVYYMDSGNGTVCSVSNGVVKILADYITNYNCFELDDYTGATMTNNQNNPVIHVTMDFYQWEYPIGFVGGNALNAYDFYTLRTKISRRCKQ